MYDKRFPPCLRRSGYAQAGIKLFQHPSQITLCKF
jgi:hypothetical protein